MGEAHDNAPFEADEITHGADREIRHVVHIALVYFVDNILPIIEVSPVRVKDGEVKRRITYGLVSDTKHMHIDHALSACHNMLRKGVPETKMTLMPMP